MSASFDTRNTAVERLLERRGASAAPWQTNRRGDSRAAGFVDARSVDVLPHSLLRLQMREPRQHAAQSLVVRLGAKGEGCGLVFRRSLAETIGRIRVPELREARRRNVAFHRRSSKLRTTPRCLVIVSTASPLLTFTRRAASLQDHFLDARLALSTAGGVAALAGLKARVYRRPAIADVVLPGVWGSSDWLIGRLLRAGSRRLEGREALAGLAPTPPSPPVISCQRRITTSQ